MIRAEKCSPNRSSVCSNRLRWPISGSKCLGRSTVDSGHSRVPAPPANITGRIGRPPVNSLMLTSWPTTAVERQRSSFLCKILRHFYHVGRIYSGGRVEGLIAFWTHALAAALFASLTLWELRRGLGESEQRMLLLA